MFFVFEGVDGAGKSTQLSMFVSWLADHGHEVVTCKDPGSTELGEELRTILLEDHAMPISMRAEMMLFTTARTQLVQEIVKPALEQGKMVVLDRYILSTIVYQGHAGKLHPQDIRDVNHIATEGLRPNVTFVLDLPVDAAMNRLGDKLDRMEARGTEYLSAVREGFRQEVQAWPTGVELIDANREIDLVQSDIREVASRYLK
ncbi:MAG: dTMP kinase [Planctomycetota bacterium]